MSTNDRIRFSEQGAVERDADRADFLDRISRLIYETETMGEEDLAGELQKVLQRYEKEWGIKATEGYDAY